ncbi:MAG: hypothetical protein ACRDHU_12415 [Actinomycetota bacterium]
MSDLRSRLERLGDQLTPPPDAFERLERTRRRRERNRRITAGAVALLVALGGSVAAFTAFRGSDEPGIGEVGPEAFAGIWPESTYEDALAVQETLDAGDPSLRWRLDAGETALAFARDAMGWSDVSLDHTLADTATASTIGVRTALPSCPNPAGTNCAREATIELRRLDGSDTGIWGVVSVSNPGIPVAQLGRPSGTGDAVTSGSFVPERFPLTISFDLPEGTNVYVAFVGLGRCAGWESDSVTPASDLQSIETPRLPVEGRDGCDVVLLVLHNSPSDHGIQELGRQLLEFGYRTDLYGLLAVRFHLGLEPTEGLAPDVAVVRCDGTEIVVDTPVVRAQADGVHFTVVATGETAFSITEDTGQAGSHPDDPVGTGQGLDTEPGDNVILSTVPPGRYLVACSPRSDPGLAGGATGTASIEVVDPAGYHVPSEPECPGGEAWGQSPAYEAGARGDVGDPVDVARGRLIGLEANDVVERAGYPDSATEPVIRIVRNGRVVATLTLFDDGRGGWLLSSLEGCGDVQFGWGPAPEEPDDNAVIDCESGNVVVLGQVPLQFTLVVEGFDFDLDCVRVPAGEPFTISLDNRDVGGTHSVSVYPEGSDEAAFSGDVCLGPGTFMYHVPALEAGSYRIVDLHSPQTTFVSLLVE